HFVSGQAAAQLVPAPQSVLEQTGASLPQFWGAFQNQSLPAHYTLATNQLTTSELQSALRALPSLFILTDPTNLFSPATGIYLHPTERGQKWERPVTTLLLDARGQTNFQARCGLRLHGGMSRRPEESPKHSFRLSFRKIYGTPKLNAPLFGTDGPQQFDALILRAGGNDSWLTSDGPRRAHATYLRDEWMCRSMEALEHRSARGRYVHLFLNSLYWGIYNLCERPGAELLDTNDSECDILKGDETESGDRVAWEELFALANSGLDDAKRYEEVSRRLDVPQFMDFMVLNFYAGNSDWDRSANWYAIRPRTATGQFHFFVWDAEQILDQVQPGIPDDPDDESPLALFHKLARNKTFRAAFITRAVRVLSESCALSPNESAKRFRDLADALAPAMSLEAARWGSYRRDVHQFKTGPYEVYSVRTHWQPEVEKISSEFFSQRRDALLQNLHAAGFEQE
ncbi:MAG: hypothetical protein EPO07_12370, partial [Verrucomicrobia bacterium]